MNRNQVLLYSFNFARSAISGIGFGMFIEHMVGKIPLFGFYGITGVAIFQSKLDKGTVHGAALSNVILSADMAYSYYNYGQAEFNVTKATLSSEVQMAFLGAETVINHLVFMTKVVGAHPFVTGSVVAVDLCYSSYQGNIQNTYSVRYAKAIYYGLKRVGDFGTSFDDIVYNFESIKFLPTMFGIRLFNTPYLDGLRQEYNDNIAKLRQDVLYKVSVDVSLINNVTFCHEISEMREVYKQQSQFKTPLFSVIPIFARQLYKYGSYTGISSEDIRSKCYKEATTTMFSALKTDGNDLGLSGSDFYGMQLSVAKALKFQVMPGQVTEDDISCAFSDGVLRSDLEVCAIGVVASTD
ncbi:MAG: hypothetical protein KBC27_00860 [Rickettsiales bacterium]|nr:hypothetical protein [Rickettsiales bacterium]